MKKIPLLYFSLQEWLYFSFCNILILDIIFRRGSRCDTDRLLLVEGIILQGMDVCEIKKKKFFSQTHFQLSYLSYAKIFNIKIYFDSCELNFISPVNIIKTLNMLIVHQYSFSKFHFKKIAYCFIQLNLLSLVFNLCSTAIFLYMNTNITNARKVSKKFMTKSIHFNQCMRQFNHLALLAMLYCKWEEELWGWLSNTYPA
jgi:hypothetical protein